MTQTKMLWMGMPIEQLSRETLLEIIEHLGRELEEYRSPERIRAYALGRVECLKRDKA